MFFIFNKLWSTSKIRDKSIARLQENSVKNAVFIESVLEAAKEIDNESFFLSYSIRIILGNLKGNCISLMAKIPK